MTELDASASNAAGSPTETEIAGDAVPVLAPLAGDPSMLGLPTFIVGSVALGLVLVGVVPATAVGASLPIILAATSIGLFIATIWSAAIGQSAVASIFGIFAGFWLSYAVLVLGLIRGWFGITLLAVNSTQELFLISWLVIVTVLTLATLRLPLAFSLIFVLVDVALLLVLLGTEEAFDWTAEGGRLRRTGLRRGRGVRLLRRGLTGHRRQGRPARQAHHEVADHAQLAGGRSGVPQARPAQCGAACHRRALLSAERRATGAPCSASALRRGRRAAGACPPCSVRRAGGRARGRAPRPPQRVSAAEAGPAAGGFRPRLRMAGGPGGSSPRTDRAAWKGD